jgi:hypothetical protein
MSSAAAAFSRPARSSSASRLRSAVNSASGAR